MLSREDNELVTRVGPGTPMGNLMRQYWVPACTSSELPHANCEPGRIMLLGEKLIGFRDTNGHVGLMQNHCPHRGASLFFGRNEENGLRCVYHGWKFDIDGNCVDMPNEPAESDFKHKVKAVAYPCVERGGLVWTYMGPRSTPPPLPDLEANMMPDAHQDIRVNQQEANWLQVLEGALDDSHAAFLHRGSFKWQEAPEDTFSQYELKDLAPRSFILDIDAGVTYAVERDAKPGVKFWRILQYLFPFFTMAPIAVLGLEKRFVCRVPMDDYHTLQYFVKAVEDRAEFEAEQRYADDNFWGQGTLPDTTDWFGRFQPVQNGSNEFGLDREVQRLNQGVPGFTGVAGILNQDGLATWGMGPIFDRSQEHLGSTDAMVARVRRRLISAARALAEHGSVPPGVDNPAAYRVRAGSLFLPDGVDWVSGTADRRQAFVAHNDLDPSIGYRI